MRHLGCGMTNILHKVIQFTLRASCFDCCGADLDDLHGEGAACLTPGQEYTLPLLPLDGERCYACCSLPPHTGVRASPCKDSQTNQVYSPCQGV